MGVSMENPGSLQNGQPHESQPRLSPAQREEMIRMQLRLAIPGGMLRVNRAAMDKVVSINVRYDAIATATINAYQRCCADPKDLVASKDFVEAVHALSAVLAMSLAPVHVPRVPPSPPPSAGPRLVLP